MISRLEEDPAAPFPPIEAALEEPDGLLAWGGDLSPQRLRAAYRLGIFPWYSGDDPLLWWCPSTRCVFDTGRLHISRSLARLIRQGRYRVTADTAFEAVVDGCARERAETWITAEMRAAYLAMHRLGEGHSIEVWEGGDLAGGLYGLAMGRMFFGESMYSGRRDASKVALVTLCGVLHAWGFPWLDCQLSNPHLLRMGAMILTRGRFRRELDRLMPQESMDGPWTVPFAKALGHESTRG